MAGTVAHKGRIVGINSREYDFTNRQTGERVQGQTHTLYLRTDDPSEPMMELRASDELVGVAHENDGKVVEIVSEPRAKPVGGGGARIVWYAVKINGQG